VDLWDGSLVTTEEVVSEFLTNGGVRLRRIEVVERSPELERGKGAFRPFPTCRQSALDRFNTVQKN